MHVLIVEDDAKIAEFVARGFREAGFRTTRAADGEDGLLQAQHGPFDAAIVDIMLPKLDGLELIRRLRASGSKLPVVILSARSSVDSRIAGLEAGADDYAQGHAGRRGHPPPAARIPASRVSPAQQGARHLQDDDPRTRVGLFLRSAHEPRRDARVPSSRQNRQGA